LTPVFFVSFWWIEFYTNIGHSLTEFSCHR